MQGATRILVVDDDPLVRRALARTLMQIGIEVDDVGDSTSALAQLDQKHYDVVLSDICMPGGGGIELLTAIRARHPDLPVMLMTGDPTTQTAIAAVELGAGRYFVKPIDGRELKAAIARVLQLRCGTRVSRPVDDLARLSADFERSLLGIWMAYQPIVDWQRREIVAYEALLRTDETAFANPQSFLTAAERLGCLSKLGRAIRGAVAARASAIPVTKIFVNLHPHDLLDDDLYAPEAPLSRVAIRVILEITERAALSDVTDLVDRVARLRNLGFRLAVDDLGEGYSGLSHVAKLEPEFVKLDMSLIRGVDSDRLKQRIVRSVVGLCRELGSTVIAEGIERPEERDTVLTLGCTVQQGYLFGRPARLIPSTPWCQ